MDTLSNDIKYKRNIATVGRVDSGKTTLTELFMFESIYDTREKRGSIEAGNTTTDIGVVERARGITINTVPVTGYYSLNSEDYSLKSRVYSLTIADTPGHHEFEYQVRTVLDCVEGALLLIPMNEGFTQDSANLLGLLKDAKLPILAVLSKIDLVDSNTCEPVIDDIVDGFERCGSKLQILQKPIYGTDGKITALEDIFYESKKNLSKGEVLYLGHDYLKERLVEEYIPVVFTSSKTGLGVKELLAYIFGYFPDPSCNVLYQSLEDKNKFTSKVINRVPKSGYSNGSVVLRVVSGGLNKGARVYNPNTNESYKLSNLYNLDGKSLIEANTGSIIRVDGLDKTNCQSGHTLSARGQKAFNSVKIAEPIITTNLLVKDEDTIRVAKALREITQWDPSYKNDGFSVSSVNSFHLGVLVDILREEYKIDVSSASPFSPRYVAVPFGKFEVEGEAFLRVQSFVVRLGIRGIASDMAYYEMKNSFTSEDTSQNNLVRYMENYFSSMLWFDKFPLCGFDLEIKSGKSPTKIADSSIKYSAIRDAINRLLYDSKRIALYEPYIQINSNLRTYEEVERLSKFFIRINGEPDFRIAEDGVFDFTGKVPFFHYMRNEDAFYRAFQNLPPYTMTSEEFSMAPPERAKQIIEQSCGYEEKAKKEFLEKAGECNDRYQHRLRNLRNLPLKDNEPLEMPTISTRAGYRDFTSSLQPKYFGDILDKR